jgi:murein DD-endopeptidase MepM/ murein hydrolase activator NlpD
MWQNKISHWLFLFMIASCVSYAGCGSEFGYKNPLSDYTVTSDFQGSRTVCANGYCTTRPHRGVDLDTNDQKPHGYATHSGTVQTIKDNGGDAGNIIYVVHDSGQVRTAYFHAGQMGVNSGDQVNAGDILGDWSTNTGRGTGTHIHYETQVQVNGRWEHVDPTVFNQMIAEGKDPCDPNFGQEALDRTIQENPGYVPRGGGAGTPNPNPGEVTPVPGDDNGGSLCV